jgi:hypothetical protein
LLTAARALRDNGTIPPGVDQPDVYRQRSGWALVPRDADFWEYLRPQREAFRSANGVVKDTASVVQVGEEDGQHVPVPASPEREKQPV